MTRPPSRRRRGAAAPADDPVERMCERIAALRGPSPDHRAWQELTGTKQLLRIGLQAALHRQSKATLQRLRACVRGDDDRSYVPGIEAHFARLGKEAAGIDVSRLARNTRLMVAAGVAAIAARLTPPLELERLLAEAADLVSPVTGQPAFADDYGTIAIDGATLRRQVQTVTAWRYVRHWLEAPPASTRTLHVPFATVDETGTGLLAKLDLARVDGAPDCLVEDPGVALRPLDGLYVDTLTTAWRNAPGPVSWSISALVTPGQVTPLHDYTAMMGDSFGAAATVGLRLLRRDRHYDPGCLLVAGVDPTAPEGGHLTRVGGEKAKLDAARGHSFATIVISDESQVARDEGVRAELELGGTRLRGLRSVKMAEECASLPIWAEGLTPLDPTTDDLPDVIVWNEFPDVPELGVLPIADLLTLSEMVLISPSSDAPFYVDPFYIDRYPVTVGRFEVFRAGDRRVPLDLSLVQDLRPKTGLAATEMLDFAESAGKALPCFDEWRAAALYRVGAQPSADAAEWDRMFRRLVAGGHFEAARLRAVPLEHLQTESGLCDLFGNAGELVCDSGDRYIECGVRFYEGTDRLQRAMMCNDVPSHEVGARAGGHQHVGFRCVASTKRVREEILRGDRVFSRRG